jgi:PST family polysaccharide transporter
VKLLKASAYSGIITFVRTLTGFISNKFVAIYLGPAGVALVGQFINFAAIIATFSNGAISNGVIKYAAEYKDDEIKSSRLYSTSFLISLSCSVLAALLLIFNADYASSQILKSSKYSWSIIALGIGTILYSLNTLLLSILNGRGQLKEYTIVNVEGTIVSLLFTIIMVYNYGLTGALLSLALSQSIVFFITLFHIVRSPWFNWRFFRQRVDLQIFKNLSKFTVMSATSVLSISVGQMLIRTNIINSFDLQSAGIWQGMLRIGESHLLIVVTALSTAYLPRLSSAKDDHSLRQEIFSAYKIAVPFIVVSSIVIYFLKSFIINLLFSKDFSSMEALFPFQLLGNFFKVLAWILSFLMQARAMARAYIITEIAFSILLVGLSHIFLSTHGVTGVMFAFFLNNLIYFITMVILFRKILFQSNRNNIV